MNENLIELLREDTLRLVEKMREDAEAEKTTFRVKRARPSSK